MTSSCPPAAATTQPGPVNTDEIIAEAILSLPTFKNYYNCGCCHGCHCSCCEMAPIPRRLYLTQSSIVFRKGLAKYLYYPAYNNFSIDLLSIKCIKTIDKELYRNGCFRSEVRTYSHLIIQLKDDSSEKIYTESNEYNSLQRSLRDVDSFYHVCLNGDDFAQAVKQQIAALNIAYE